LQNFLSADDGSLKRTSWKGKLFSRVPLLPSTPNRLFLQSPNVVRRPTQDSISANISFYDMRLKSSYIPSGFRGTLRLLLAPIKDCDAFYEVFRMLRERSPFATSKWDHSPDGRYSFSPLRQAVPPRDNFASRRPYKERAELFPQRQFSSPNESGFH